MKSYTLKELDRVSSGPGRSELDVLEKSHPKVFPIAFAFVIEGCIDAVPGLASVGKMWLSEASPAVKKQVIPMVKKILAIIDRHMNAKRPARAARALTPRRGGKKRR